MAEHVNNLIMSYVFVGTVYHQLGNHRQLMETADIMAKLVPSTKPSTAFYNAACLLSLASDAAAKDEDLAEAERTTLVDKYAARAVALLIEDQSLGYFKDAANVAHMKKDTDLDPLRERDDFKQFLKELEASETNPDEPADDE